MPVNERRGRRLRALVAEHGISRSCELPPPGALPRWALLETGPDGQAWWTVGDNWRALLRESAAALHASDWPATRMFDLDTSFSSGVQIHYRLADRPRRQRARRRSVAGATRAG